MGRLFFFNSTVPGLPVRPYWREYILARTILIPLWPAVILFGLIANLTNIVVFLKCGIRDNVTILLLSLSMSDMTYLILSMPTVCQTIILDFDPGFPWPFDPKFIGELLHAPAVTAYDLSSLISVLLGVTRCACVAMPLQFKSVFTKARTVKILITVLIVAVALRGPILSIFRVAWVTDSHTNRSYPPYWREYILARTILIPLWPAIILFGLMANLTNIIVFFKCGIRDNVTILLLSLSMSDMTYLILSMPTVCQTIILDFDPDFPWPFDPKFIGELLHAPAVTAYDLSSLISVLLGVTRCACVAMPLQFKSVFTKARTVKILITILIVAVALRGPILSIFRVTWTTDSHTNRSYPYVAVHNAKQMVRINDILNRNLLPWINFIIMITCVAVLGFKLSQASIVRKSYTFKSGTESENSKRQGLSPKDLHVIQSVVLVCAIFLASQLPFLAYSTIRLINSEFDRWARLHNLFTIWSSVGFMCAYLNASLNIFVYYNFNSKYKSTLLSIFK
ncbi:chemosensory receptor a [Plakobranchus ocellatus]|uniref:Chemosensory receptor a n=1 Tax=Plakobranchus ocellatus TaxID=259542 RepID=A0AAV3YYT5_9GAST|nr:chemosensory receptor a [Plakobranchus ocellatus]